MKKIAILFIVVALILSACGESINGEQRKSLSATDIELTGDGVRDIAVKLSDDLQIYSDIFPNKDIDTSKYGLYKGEMKDLSVHYDDFYNEFIEGKEITEEIVRDDIIDQYFEDVEYRLTETADGGYITTYGSYIGYSFKPEESDIASPGQFLIQPEGEERFYHKGEDLPEMDSVEEVATLVKSLLSKLGIEVLDNYTSFTISYDLLMKKEEYKGLVEEFDYKGYWMEFYWGIDNVAITSASLGSFDNGVYQLPMQISTEYIDGKLQSLDVNNYYDFEEEIPSENALPLEYFIPKLAEYYEGRILEDTKTVYGIEFAYAPVATDTFNEFVMTPVWSFYVKNDNEVERFEVTSEVLMFNAIDGTLINTTFEGGLTWHY